MSGRVQGSPRPPRADRLASFGVAFAFCLASALIVAAAAIMLGAPAVATLVVAVVAALFVAAAVSR